MHVAFRNTSLVVGVFAVCILLAIVGGAYVISTSVADNCKNVHTLYHSIDKILLENDGRIASSKTLTSGQKKEYLIENRNNRFILRQGDCP